MKNQRIARHEKLLDFHKISAIIHKNFTVLVRDRTRLIPLVLFPVFMILIFGYTSGNIPTHISAVIVPYDHSQTSQNIQEAIQQSKVFAVRNIVSSEGEALRLLDSGQVRVIIEIPANLELDLSKGVPTAVTVIVDESDSAIAGTSKQTLTAIVNQLSNQISREKIASFQLQVASAGAQLQKSCSLLPDQYGQIALKLQASEPGLISSKKVTDSLAAQLVASLALPTLAAPLSATRNLTVENTFYSPPPGYYNQLAEISALQGASAMVASSQSQIDQAKSLAQASDQAAAAMQDHDAYYHNVVQPMEAIQVFAKSDTNAILQPLVYEEKPAYGTGKTTIDFLIPAIIALTIFQGAVFGMGRAVAGEKREGSLTRVFLTPTSNATIISGTLAFYVLFEICRSIFLILVSMAFFHLRIEGSLIAIALIIILFAGVSTAIGMILSSAVKTEGQYTAMSMLVTMPTLFLSGVFFPLQAMPKVLQYVATFLPITYAGDALRGVMIKGFSVFQITYDLSILLLFVVVAVAVVFMVFKRDIE